MKFSIGQKEFLNALGIVIKGTSSNSTMPFLSGIHIFTDDEFIVFQSTDLELSIQYRVPALIEETGSAVLPGKLLNDIVKTLPNTAVQVDTQGLDTVITCDSAIFSIKGLNPVDFPSFPEVEPVQEIKLPFETFSKMAKAVSKYVSKDMSKIIYTGVLVSLKENSITFAATDMYRLGESTFAVENIADDFEVLISGSFMSELAGLPMSGEDISLAVAENQILVRYGSIMLVNRRIEGNYPNYHLLFKGDRPTKVTVNAGEMIDALRRATAVKGADASIDISFDVDTQTLQLTTTDLDLGSTQETLVVKIEGPSTQTRLKAAYLTEALRTFGKKDALLEMGSPDKPCTIKSADMNNFVCLIMPMRKVD